MDSLPTIFQGMLGILLFTSFVKIATTFSILRYGIGLHDSAFGLVILALSFALTLLVMDSPVSGMSPWDRIFARSGTITEAEFEKEFRPFLVAHTDEKLTARLSEFSKKQRTRAGSAEEGPQANDGDSAQPSLYVLSSSFLLTELRAAFYVGLILLIPFLVVDLLVTNTLMAIGVTQMPHAVAALPLKLLVFYALDGWALVTEKIISGYAL